MVLSGVGDALGYREGHWEFCPSGPQIHDELRAMGGLQAIHVDAKHWPISDDTVMHMATALGLISGKTGDALYCRIADLYQKCVADMPGRGAGRTCMDSARKLKPHVAGGYRIRFYKGGGGCGAAMRAMCIGLLYPRPEELEKLIEVSVETGRMTHNHPTGYLGAVAAALFTAYSIQGKRLREWGKGLMDTLPDVMKYIRKVGIDVEANEKTWDYFSDQWNKYLDIRGIADGCSDPTFPEKYEVEDRDAFYQDVSYDGMGGASGHDAPMIAYDALLGCNGSWEELCNRAMFHGGDSDSTGVIAGACYGAMHGFQGVPEVHYRGLEYREQLENLATSLWALSHPGDAGDFQRPDVNLEDMWEEKRRHWDDEEDDD